MNIPVLRETVSFTNLSGVAVSICSIVSFNKGYVNHITDRRGFYRSFDLRFATEDRSQINLNHPPFSSSLMNSGIDQALYWNTTRTFGATAFARMYNCGVFAVSLQNSPFIRSIFVRSDQIHNATISSFLKIQYKLLNVFCRSLAWYNAYHQTILRVVSYMIPVVSLQKVLRNIVITMFSFLTHKRPFLIELNLIGFRGKRLPTHREVPWHVRRRGVNNASQYFYLRPPDALFCGPHNLQRYAQTKRWLFSPQASYGTVACLFVRKIASCMFGSIAAGYDYFFRIYRTLINYLHHVFRNPGIFYFDNRILKELALSCLLNVILCWTTICPSFRISSKTSKNIQLC